MVVIDQIDGRRQVVIENVQPAIDCGRFSGQVKASSAPRCQEYVASMQGN